ncbi:MAG: FAD-dependent oxidoreductase [Eubacteriales bacterium]|nr:FAD-dependent oxidoreductase [Eubacteriales bacterium]
MRTYDVVVCGGGVAGIAAALAAARQGAKTCLLEKEYALGGLATLGLIVIYLPLCDGEGVQMSGGICEELLKLSLKYGPGEIPAAWQNPTACRDERAKQRYQVQYQAGPFMIAAEELLLSQGVTIFYDARLGAVKRGQQGVEQVLIDTKMGQQAIAAKAFIDATGDADLCYFAGEQTVDDDGNRRTGWYFSYDGQKLALHGQTDPIYGEIPAGSRLYSGTKLEDIAEHMFAMRRMILSHMQSMHAAGNTAAYPLLIPAYHGLRMTRRLAGTFEFSDDAHERVWFTDAIGMIGSWKQAGKRYSIPYRCITGMQNHNLYAAGRCVSAEKSGWDLTRVIPTCAITGEAAGIAAALQAHSGQRPAAAQLQRIIMEQGGLLDSTLFTRQQQA